jgi:hypothetical protein
VLRRIDVLAENMLVLAAAEGRRSLTSWHALAVSGRSHPGDSARCAQEVWIEAWCRFALHWRGRGDRYGC